MASPNWADTVYDSGVSLFTGGNVTRVDVCHTEPTTYTQATSTYSMVNYTVTGGSFTLAAGDGSGRKATLAAQSGNIASSAGNGLYVAFTNGTDTLYGIIDGDGDAIGNGQQVDIAAVDVIEIQAAT